MPFETVKSDDETLEKVQANVGKVVKAIEANPLAGARVSAVTAITTADTKVYHNLGRTPKAWWPASPSAAATFYAGSASSDPSRFVNIRASVASSAAFVFI